MHARSAALLSLALTACSRKTEPPAPAPATTIVHAATAAASAPPSASSPAPSASALALPAPPSSPKAPAHLRRVSPKKVTASSFVTEGKSHWVPQLAIDKSRSTSWQSSDDHPWIEATFDKPTKVWAVRSDAGWLVGKALEKHARPKSVRLRLGDVDTYDLAVDKDAHAADFLGLANVGEGRAVTSVRLTYTEQWPGEAPLAISELSFWTDADEAPAAPLPKVEEEIAALGGDVEKAKALLLRFSVVPKAGEYEAVTATLHPAITNDIRVLEVTMTRKESTWAAYVFVAEIERDGMRRLVGLDSEIIEDADGPEMKLTKVHDVNDDRDVLLTWKVLRENKPALYGLRVVSLARGAVEKIADFVDERTPHIDADHPRDGRFDIVLDKTEQKPLWRTQFDERAFWYW